ncbi:MAG: hypothetical protein CM1200mP41_31800 [Gammaproteobacteria bacterium]|nr:MAG: hypothetical protein CM1200mP41_31800 [Gammaproteobacteria bacterium]
MLYQDMGKEALDAAYNNTAAVGMEQRDQYVADWVNRSGVVKEAWLPTCDIPTAPTPDNVWMCFPAGGWIPRRCCISMVVIGR